jgi:F0F1-type ATP synthase assembly protein I
MPEGMPAAMWAGSVACGGIMAILPPLVPVIFVFGRRGREAMAEWSTAGSPWQLPQA